MPKPSSGFFGSIGTFLLIKPDRRTEKSWNVLFFESMTETLWLANEEPQWSFSQSYMVRAKGLQQGAPTRWTKMTMDISHSQYGIHPRKRTWRPTVRWFGKGTVPPLRQFLVSMLDFWGVHLQKVYFPASHVSLPDGILGESSHSVND